MIRNAAIVGAGVAGMATGIALEQVGIRTTVYEQADRLRCFGGALTLWSNAVRVLRRLRVESQLRAAGCELHCMEFRSPDGRLLWTMPVAEASRRQGAPSMIVPRAALLEGLADGLSEIVRFRKRYASHRELGDGVTVRFEDGTTASADLLIGADGGRSRIRAALNLDFGAPETGTTLWVGRSAVRHPLLVPGRPVATVSRDLRFWMAAMPSGETYWYAVLDGRHRASDVERLSELFADFYAPIGQLIAESAAESRACTEVLDRFTGSRWSSARVTLVGDAAHTTRPEVGQGACQSLESALELARQLSGAMPVARALREYEMERFPRAAHVNALAYLTANHTRIRDKRLREWSVAHLLPPLALPALDWLLRGDGRT